MFLWRWFQHRLAFFELWLGVLNLERFTCLPFFLLEFFHGVEESWEDIKEEYNELESRPIFLPECSEGEVLVVNLKGEPRPFHSTGLTFILMEIFERFSLLGGNYVEFWILIQGLFDISLTVHGPCLSNRIASCLSILPGKTSLISTKFIDINLLFKFFFSNLLINYLDIFLVERQDFFMMGLGFQGLRQKDLRTDRSESYAYLVLLSVRMTKASLMFLNCWTSSSGLSFQVSSVYALRMACQVAPLYSSNILQQSVLSLVTLLAKAKGLVAIFLQKVSIISQKYNITTNNQIRILKMMRGQSLNDDN